MKANLRRMDGDPTVYLTFSPESDQERFFCDLIVEALRGKGSIIARLRDGRAAAWRAGKSFEETTT